jgi:hypothetical protein
MAGVEVKRRKGWMTGAVCGVRHRPEYVSYAKGIADTEIHRQGNGLYDT